MGAYPEGELAAPLEALVELDGAGDGEAVTEDQDLGPRIDPISNVVGQHFFAPFERVAAVMAGTIKKLAKIGVKITQKCPHAVNIAQRNTQVAPVLFGPRLKGIGLAVAQPRPQRLTGLQVLMGHGA